MDLGIQKKITDALFILSTAVKNLSLYPSSSAIITQTIDRLYQSFAEIFHDDEAIIFAESERNLRIGGVYPFNVSDSVTMVTELMAMARPAHSGRIVIPKRGKRTPAAMGMRAIL